MAVLCAVACQACAGCRSDEPSTTVAPQPSTISATITGASMAPHFPGEHVRLTCSRCRRPFSIDALTVPRDHLATCPNCGYSEISIEMDHVQSGIDVDVRPLTFTTNPDSQELRTLLPRWSVTAWRHPLEDNTATVKRLIAYPNERIAIQQGDVFVNGQRLRKDWPQQLATMIDVHHVIDQAVLVRSHELEAHARWHAKGGWRQVGTQWIADAEDTKTSSPVELTFTHFRTAPANTRPREPVPIEDNDAFNQATSRNLNAIGDLMVMAEVEHHDAQMLQLSIHNGEEWVQFELQFAAGKVVVELPGSEIAWESPLPKLPEEDKWQLGASTFDHQVVLTINSEVLVCEPLPESIQPRAWQPQSSPVQFRSNAGSGLQLNQLYVGRDIFYLDPHGSANRWTDATDPAEGFFVLGDNAPVSRDSRHWQRGDLTLDRLIGIVEPPIAD